ncbi:MAG: type II and III secretion system protein [Bryobacterales bacterium]|nr:type II and III secretion system protein [Bryobacterales bacterium]
MELRGIALVSWLTFAALLPAQSPGQLRNEARKAEKSGDALRAYVLYAQAAGADRADPSSWSRAVSLRGRAMQAMAGLKPPAATAGTPDAASAVDVPTADDLFAARQMRAPLRLKPNPRPRSLSLTGDSRTLATEVLKSYGIDAIFDSDFQPLPNLRLRIEGAGFNEAAEAMQLATATFLVPVSPTMALVSRDLPNKRQEFEHTMAIAVPLPTSMTVQEAQELARAVQSLMEIQKFGVDPNQRVAVIRDRESKVLPALVLFEDLIRHRGQVMLDVELLEASSLSETTLGFRLPTEFPLSLVRRVFNTTPALPSGFANFLSFGGGASLIGIGLANSQLFANFTQSNGRTLNRAQLRGIDNQPIQFHLGDRYPVLTAGYFGDTGGATGEVFRPPPTVNFEDLGVVLKITPHVHGVDEMTLDIEAEYKVLTGQALNGIPVIATRSFKAGARLASGETAVIAGLLRASEARSVTGLAGLSQIPALGHLFRQETRNKDEGEALLVIRPHVIDLPPSHLSTRTVHTGTDGRPRIPL